MNINLKLSKTPNFSTFSRESKPPKKYQNLGLGYLLKLKTLLGLSSKGFNKIDLSKLQRKYPSRYLDWNALILKQSRSFIMYHKELVLDRRDVLIKNNFYKGVRFSIGLPLRGQRTHTNARTARRLLNK